MADTKYKLRYLPLFYEGFLYNKQNKERLL